MTIVGRLTKDAVVNTLPDGRKVVNFSVAVNDSYKPKGGERQRLTAYYSCAFWKSEKIAPYLKKGTLVETDGRLTATPYTTKEGEVKASLNCHVDTIKIHAGAKEVEVIGQPAGASAPNETEKDDLPF